ncbi:bifunctional Peptidyl-tRNA hydrolase II domain superfamily/Peptidyl-tRNA hydrolase [Babesia duncani]|uniref:peptidyl-tRNA hydrolase n=1 Tax=Babesia duncani TaxID=323732 RepID=A0AAD9PLR0_9APIC|nr:bifunctional Peptidyl-tRNA hydrolase II domain superfamily/Peptidyl-tRNA hydrolase [Babesia duncani]
MLPFWKHVPISEVFVRLLKTLGVAACLFYAAFNPVLLDHVQWVYHWSTYPRPKEPLNVSSDEECKLVLCVRMDLGMGRGKIAAQCSHAAVDAVLNAQKSGNKFLSVWLESGQRKVVVRVPDLNEMNKLKYQARILKLGAHQIHDAGRTQIPAGSATVLAVGPGNLKFFKIKIAGPESLVNTVTGHLKLL